MLQSGAGLRDWPARSAILARRRNVHGAVGRRGCCIGERPRRSTRERAVALLVEAERVEQGLERALARQQRFAVLVREGSHGAIEAGRHRNTVRCPRRRRRPVCGAHGETHEEEPRHLAARPRRACCPWRQAKTEAGLFACLGNSGIVPLAAAARIRFRSEVPCRPRAARDTRAVASEICGARAPRCASEILATL